MNKNVHVWHIISYVIQLKLLFSHMCQIAELSTHEFNIAILNVMQSVTTEVAILQFQMIIFKIYAYNVLKKWIHGKRTLRSGFTTLKPVWSVFWSSSCSKYISWSLEHFFNENIPFWSVDYVFLKMFLFLLAAEALG